MNDRQQKLVVGAVAAFALVGGVAAFVAFGGGDAVREITGTDAHHEPTAEPQMEDTEAAFDFGVDDIEECGTTCRDVTATLSNVGDEPAEDVTVETTMFTDGDIVWEGTEELGGLDADEAFTSTERVDIGADDAARIEANDGQVTIETVVVFEDGQDVFVEEHDVS
ncbi:hypothetical protein JCM17823_17480 [Halorubrum gandharaense]